MTCQTHHLRWPPVTQSRGTRSNVIQAKLAENHTLSEHFTEALECYHVAISMNPQNGLAIQGLERLEKIMRGVNPDEEMDEDGEVDEEDGGQEYY